MSMLSSCYQYLIKKKVQNNAQFTFIYIALFFIFIINFAIGIVGQIPHLLATRKAFRS